MEKGLVSQSNLGFVEHAMQSIDNMLQYSQTLLDSGLCPKHFYELDARSKPILTQGKPAAVVMVLQHGFEVGLSPMQALQQIVPVNGLITIKGDGGKSLIFQSGVLESGSWKEEESGNIQDETYTYKITAKRKDNGVQMTREFSVDAAKRAGLWIEDSKIRGNDGWKHKLSAWYKYPDRMIRYRALGFLERDLFTDILAGMYTSEEAGDIQEDTAIVIPVGEAAVVIPDKDFSQGRSERLTTKASKKLEKEQSRTVSAHPVEKLEEAEIVSSGFDIDTNKEHPDTNAEQPNINALGKEFPKKYTEDELQGSPIELLRDIISQDIGMKDAMVRIKGQNTNKKLRLIILNNQAGELEAYVSANVGGEPIATPKPTVATTTTTTTASLGFETEGATMPKETPDPAKVDIPEKETESFPATENKFGILVTPPSVEGKREMGATFELHEALETTAGLDNKRYSHLISTEKHKHLQKYPGREELCFNASVEEINNLLNSLE